MTAAAGARALRPLRQLPEPERFWIRFAPRSWPAAPPSPRRWVDLARGRLGRPGAASGDAVPTAAPPTLLPDGPFDDVLYVPPVASGDRAERDRALGPILAAGTPVLVQLLPGQPAPSATQDAEAVRTGDASGATVVVDLLAALLGGELETLDRLPPDAVVAWPLVGGLTDGAALREAVLGRLAGAGVRVVQPLVPELAPAERRELAEGRDESVFDALFHGQPPDPRVLARAVARHGMSPFLTRPLPRAPLAGAPSREIGGLLLLAGELCQRLGHHGRGQAHFRAARWVDRSRYDLRVLAAEGNLQVIHWLDPASREIVDEWARTGRSATVDALAEEYAGPVG